MSETPTASALVLILLGKRSKGGRTNADLRDCGSQLASRVEAVLALLKKYRTIPADLIERILDGGRP